jgi:thiol-disulfide isomerase/thioredoxin
MPSSFRLVAVLGLVLSASSFAQNPATPGADPATVFEALVAEFEAADAAYREQAREASRKAFEEYQKKLAEAEKAAATRPAGEARPAMPAFGMQPSGLGPSPRETFAPRFAAFAAANGTTPSAARAHVWLVENAWTSPRPGAAVPAGAVSHGEESLSRLLADFPASEVLAEVCPVLASQADSPHSERAEQALRTLTKIAAHEEARAAAFGHLGKLLLEDEGVSWAQVDGKMKRVDRFDAAALKARHEEAKSNLRELRERFPKSRAVKALGGLLFEVEHLQPGMIPPDFEVRGVDGATYKLSQFRGKVVAIDFWATWCGPCMQLLPHAVELTRKLEGKPFTFFGVSADRAEADLLKQLEKAPLPWPNAFQDSKRSDSLHKLWNVRGYPTVVLLDHTGAVRHRFLGVDAKVLEEAILKLVAEAETVRK